jgi:hypothetical protein
MLSQILRRDVVAGALKACKQFGPTFAQRRERALDLRFTFADVGIASCS